MLILPSILACLMPIQDAEAKDVIAIENFNNLNQWTVVENGRIDVSTSGLLNMYQQSDDFNAIYRHDIELPSTYTVEFNSQINQFSQPNKDALGLRLRDSQYLLDMKFRNNALYVLSKKEDGTKTLIKIKTVDENSHDYKAVVKEGIAEIYVDGEFVKKATLLDDLRKEIVFLYNSGTETNPADALVDNIRISYTTKSLGGGEPIYSKEHFSVFNKISSNEVDKGEGSFSYELNYTESETEWNADNLDPTEVWRTTLQHQNPDHLKNWEIRIGKGGQIYSFRTAAGELIPPQEHAGAEWIDEVFQVVTVNTKSNIRLDSTFEARSFVHQAGTYWKKAVNNNPLDPEFLNHSWYSPMLAEYHDQSDQSYSSLTWGQYSHTPSIYASGQLIYSNTRDLGDGVIEFTHVVTNRGSDTINWLNLPWGGVRPSNLPKQLMSNPDGSFTEHNRYFGQRSSPADSTDMGIFNHDTTGGWFAWANGTKADDHGLSLVFGLDQHWTGGEDAHYRKSHFKWGEVRTKSRDYNVGVNVIPVNILPGQSFYSRYYMVVGDIEHISEKSQYLVNYVDYGLLNITEEVADKLAYVETLQTNNGYEQAVLSDNIEAQTPLLSLYTDPVTDAVPMFLMRNTTTGQHFISNNPYENSTIVDYVNPFNRYVDEDWHSLGAWTERFNGGTIQLIDKGLLLFDSSFTTNHLLQNTLIPDEYIAKLNTKIDQFGSNNSDALLFRLTNDNATLELKFRNGNLYYLNSTGTSVTLIDTNINFNEWHEYQIVTSFKSSTGETYAELLIDGKALVNNAGESKRVRFLLPPPTSENRVLFFVRGKEEQVKTLLGKIIVEDLYYSALNEQKQYKPYDGSTDYIGLMGYAMSEEHSSETLRYINLSDVLKDKSYYLNPNNLNLNVLEDSGN